MNIEKLIQSCNYLLKKSGFRLNYTKLIKLLYLADKELLDVTNATMTGDTAAIKLSCTCLLKQQAK